MTEGFLIFRRKIVPALAGKYRTFAMEKSSKRAIIQFAERDKSEFGRQCRQPIRALAGLYSQHYWVPLGNAATCGKSEFEEMMIMNWSKYKILFFDLDGTLLNSQKCISDMTIQSIMRCKEKGIKIAVCTSRSESNSLAFIEKINPDILVTSGGALVKIGSQYVFRYEFDSAETKTILQQIRALIGHDCEITVDTVNANYWNYKINPNTSEQNWGYSIYTDFYDFDKPALKICTEIVDETKVSSFFDCFSDYDCVRFSDGNWYKITKKNITKENAIKDVVSYYGYALDDVISFGDDFADIGMLKMSGLGIAMGNSIREVKEVADIIIGTNDQDGIACFLNQYIL